MSLLYFATEELNYAWIHCEYSHRLVYHRWINKQAYAVHTIFIYDVFETDLQV